MKANPALRFALADLVAAVGGSISGNEKAEISGFAPIERVSPTEAAFVEQPKFLAAAREAKAAVLIVRPRDAAQMEGHQAQALWLHDNPYLAFARASQEIERKRHPRLLQGIHPTAVVSPDAIIHPSANVGAGAVIEGGARIGAGCDIGALSYVGADVTIGDDTQLEARATVHHGCVIGARCILHSGCVIGADGFGLAPDRGAWIKIPQIGRVVMGDDVEIGCNTTIDRGALDDTIIGKGVKLDNLIQIGHNCEIGDHTAVAGCAGIAGSVKIGKHCMIAGAAMIGGHIEICDNVFISGATSVFKSITEPGRYSSTAPLLPHREWEKNTVIQRNLADLRARLRALEKQVGTLADPS
ncbi:UDP-3-O-(3-hydroxymyristoyl)glucosamine N-acyltransferase [Derxia gummosa]|uniref:UDP-3-O-acylglucosamine N-acyltransferase n=1 Tax=Derxia gummosa DSM 723 TaxID=1121388 RepID=A0A9U5D0C9_9BURK|nr:UDP-3-O-(3-hydroxymyristoyl)glucosamine N-acyltransferase [Derxia gummosa]